jgi:modulator of drug activity B
VIYVTGLSDASPRALLKKTENIMPFEALKKVFIINGSQHFAHSGARFNKTILGWDESFFTTDNGFDLKITDISEPYDMNGEVEKFVWADIVIYHTPVWWFGLPHKFKEYIDRVFTAGHRTGMYYSDGRKRNNPSLNYGTGGSLQGRRYLLTTTWNAPETAFTLPGEFFDQRNVDNGVMFGFHKMNAFVGMKPLQSFHFHDVEKNATTERMEQFRQQYLAHLGNALDTDAQTASHNSDSSSVLYAQSV